MITDMREKGFEPLSVYTFELKSNSLDQARTLTLRLTCSIPRAGLILPSIDLGSSAYKTNMLTIAP